MPDDPTAPGKGEVASWLDTVQEDARRPAAARLRTGMSVAPAAGGSASESARNRESKPVGPIALMGITPGEMGRAASVAAASCMSLGLDSRVWRRPSAWNGPAPPPLAPRAPSPPEAGTPMDPGGGMPLMPLMKGEAPDMALAMDNRRRGSPFHGPSGPPL